MTSDPEGALERLQERIDESADIDAADREVLRAADEALTLLSQEYSAHRHSKLLRHGVLMAERHGGLAVAVEDRDAAETLVAWINREFDNEETNRDYRSALRVLATHVAGTDGKPPESVAWIPTTTSSDYDPTPDPREMLHWDEHIQPMLDSCDYVRDRAMIALQWDAGLRGGEFKALRVGDLQDHRHGLQLTVDGKQGQRSLVLVPSVGYVQAWLDTHPGGDGDPLWSHLNRPDAVSDRMIYDIFGDAAADADIDRPVTLTNFRKSSAAFLASRNLNQAHIEDHHGWVRGSDAAARYISVFSEDSDREVARAHGIDIAPDEEPDPTAIVCPRCEQRTPTGEPTCVWCGQALDAEAAREIEESEQNLRTQLAEMDPEDARRLVDLADMLDDPDIRNALLE